MTRSKRDNRPWYKDGLRFQCTECGQCCTGSPGYVWLSIEEMERIAGLLQLPLEEFQRRFVRKAAGRYSLKETLPHFDCIFLKEKRCSIYEARPGQCRTYPFWPQNLKSPASWQAAATQCEGISEKAPLLSLDEINQMQNAKGDGEALQR